jgi:hypothetical protein
MVREPKDELSIKVDKADKGLQDRPRTPGVVRV